MLIGQYDGRIGEKYRIAFPKKFRSYLGDSLIITKGFESSLIIVSEKNWKTLLEGTAGQPFTSFSTRQMQRFLLGGASSIELDTKGRFIIPEYLRSYASITDDVVFLGLERYVEVWSKKSWKKQTEEIETKIESIAERLEKQTTDE